MNKAAICFTRYGQETILKLNNAAMKAGIEPCKAYIAGDSMEVSPGFERIGGSLDAFVKGLFENGSAIIFTGAVGIAVRLIAPYVRDKLKDSPVLVIDDSGRFVIPILSGHVGMANKLALTVAELIDAIPVITTSTDVHDAFSADVFAIEKGLTIRNREGIGKVSAKAIEGKRVTLSIKDYPPKEPVDIIIADETDREYSLLLSPRKYTFGIGMKRDTDIKTAEQCFMDFLNKNDIKVEEIYAVCTIDIKENEPAIRDFCSKYRLPLLTFEAGILSRVQGNFTSSDFVKNTVGVDNVCERAAVLGAGAGGKLYIKKSTGPGITMAVARRDPGYVNKL